MKFQCKWVSLMRLVHYLDNFRQVPLVVLLSRLHCTYNTVKICNTARYGSFYDIIGFYQPIKGIFIEEEITNLL